MSETPEPDEIQPGPAQPAGEEEAGQTQSFGPDAGFSQDATYGQGAPYGQDATFGAGPAYGQPWGQPVDLRTVTGPAPVLMSFAGPEKQRRLTVAFRAILVFPHWIALFALGIAAEVVAFIGWWAALFTGQLPDWAHQFLTSVLRWQTRVLAYMHLLTDQYPPFSLDDADYPVRLVTKQTRLNRLAVFFRLILAIPAGLLAAVAAFGIAILSFFAWLITLITGQMPAGLHEAFAAVTRFYARYGGYLFMVTPEYPAGLYGDKAPQLAAWTPDSAAGGDAPVLHAPVLHAPVLHAPVLDAPVLDATVLDATVLDAPVLDAQPATGFGAAPAAAADPWRLPLSGSGRTLVTVSLVVGLLGSAGYIALIIAVAGSGVNQTLQRASANIRVTTDYNQLASSVSSFRTKTAACPNIACVTVLDTQVGQAFQAFSTGVQGAAVPSSLSADVTAVTATSSKLTDDFNQLATAQSVSQYTSLAGSLSLAADTSHWQGAVNKLRNDLAQP